MTIPDAAVQHRESLARYTLATTLAARRLWRRIRPNQVEKTFPGVELLTLLSAAQLAAANEATRYVPLVLAEQGIDTDQMAEPRPRSLVGVASSGVALELVTTAPMRRVMNLIRQGVAPADALAAGQTLLDGIVSTQIADAARDAESVAMAVTPAVTGYVRHLNLPSCDRCAILAGRFYRWSDGFNRHPRCDCVHLPTNHPDAFRNLTDTKELIRNGQVTGLSAADRKAILEDGADPAKVVNARRGAQSAQVFGRRLKATTEGTTRRGAFGRSLDRDEFVKVPGQRYRRATTVRLRPESIYQLADDRAHAVELLKKYGYVR